VKRVTGCELYQEKLRGTDSQHRAESSCSPTYSDQRNQQTLRRRHQISRCLPWHERQAEGGVCGGEGQATRPAI
jgi:hypothetical protein